MDWPGETPMLLLFGLYDGERLTIHDDGLWLSTGDAEQAYLIPWHATDELLRRGWAGFPTEEWDAPLRPTETGLYYLEKWLKQTYPHMRRLTLPQIRRDFRLRPQSRVYVAA